MPKVKISDFSTTAGNNTDINSINIAEGCAPSGINDAIRTLMAYLKDWQSGAVSQDNSFNGAVTVSGATVLSSTLAVTGAQTNSSNLTLNGQSDLRFADSDSSNWVAFQAPATVASNVTWTLPAADGTANQVLNTDGAGVLGWGTPATLASPLAVTGNSSAGAEIRLPEDTDNGTNYVALKAADTLAGNVTFTLPNADGTNGQVLQTNGSGVLSFVSGASLATPLAVIGNSSAGAEIRLPEDTDNGTNYVALKAPDSLAADYTCTLPDETCTLGFRNIPQNSKSAAYTLVLTDAGKHIFHPSSDNNARTFTIPANSSVAYPIGTAITFINMSVASVTIAITSDTMYLSSAGTTGSRTLAQYGSATAIKIDSTTWIISGSGLT